MRVISYNIRYHNPADGENAWPQRKERVADLLRRHQPDLIGLQEVLHDQLTDLATRLPEYGWLGVGRDDGRAKGEYAPIFYRRDRLALAASDTFWLSATPEQPGTFGWDAACVRIATWARMTDKATGATLLHLNTHFDHRGTVAQAASAQLLHTFLRHETHGQPALVTGDFNCTEASVPYQILTRPVATDDTPLLDAMHHAATPHQGPTATFNTNFADPLHTKIDFIFVRPATTAAQLSIAHHAILADQTEGRYPSDHLPVLVDFARY
ncbi:MAG: endonuclease/exonuclease/phosphatase family protein [Caldilineaceae bacterium]